ncbi:MAG: HAMP domain-containing sensor histidine kinase [Stenotrophomonas geniculata]
MLALASLLLATLVSMAVVGWLPRPAPPPIQLPASRVRLVWSGSGKAPEVHVIEGSTALNAAQRHQFFQAQGQLLGAIQLPPFELAVQQADGHWRVVSSNHSDVAAWRRQVLLALLVGTALLAPLAAWAAIRLGRPLRRLADASAEGDLRSMAPLPDDGPREVQMLAAAINASRIRLREQAQEMTRMLAAVAHDLRTPLTGLRLRAEFAPPESARRMVADIDRMNVMIQQVLDYAHGELEPPSMQLLDLAALLEDCVQSARLRGVEIQTDFPGVLLWEADGLLLRRALDNLIDNAARYAGPMELQVRCTDDLLLLHLADRGPGIPAEDRMRLLRPFQRSEASRSRATGGAGLGLAVAAIAARHHGGDLQLLERVGGGLLVRMLLRREHCSASIEKFGL